MTNPVVSIDYHSGFGHTSVLAEAVRDGVTTAGATAHLINVEEISEEQWNLLDASDAIIFGLPTYMGTASAVFHAFAEASSKRWFNQVWKDKIAAGFTISAGKGGDQLNTLEYFTVLAGQHHMHWVGLGLMPGWNATTASENDLNRLGFFLGAAAQGNQDQGVEGVHEADIATAAELGKRVVEVARVYAAGRTVLAA
ncbi:flavodoxin family protein [Streptomyces sp. SP17KL33]|uniref:flavodoxin family protein n=1 Tax=Streptomyces sp. SP17KL33 TaxID=3002534 RepID=UPI002E75C26A|nr:flavodoxin family protein [Streptomyces sp. SP17KL33]MEE1833997.1 flavodoxin family protein [Streptomyces sp. SP17KL33]